MPLEANVAVADTGCESVEVLVAAENETNLRWILDSGCSYHLTANQHWFEDYKSKDGGRVMLGKKPELAM